MKSYTITVNGNVYDVTVEETTGMAPASAAVSGRMPASVPGMTSSPVSGGMPVSAAEGRPSSAAGRTAAVVGGAGSSAVGGTMAAGGAVPSPTDQPASTALAAEVGAVAITAGAAGKVVDIAATVGMSVSKGDPVVILEIMKMETPVVAPQDGTLASIHIEKGQSVAAGEVLATMN
ncbi:MAG: acetyl-CoA carboxylase biotin carboxyl carrier protein subunit [Clostridiales bacterium]|nr:acetyl-CoA carboxylase biotin carboxyl carrier protein subunit [Clostridiales bacterium]